MPVVVPILRVCTLFLNTYDSFKVLKVPPPSRRNPGQPSVRAMTQRKRDMKGIMAVWIVWCFIALYEKLVEHIVCIFIPFYDEIKSLILLFLLLTRARGAEPIYLHIVRPFFKPYAPTIDAILGFCASLGDFFFALLLSPFNVSSSWWNRQTEDRRGELDTDQPDMQTPQGFSYLDTPESGFAVNSSIDLPATNPGYPDPGFIPEYVVPGMPIGAPREHQIWNPPPSSYAPEELTPEQEEEQRRQDEWRKYPQFPSAYPSTPYVPSRLSLHREPLAHESPIVEESTTGQDFHKSLLTAREPSDPNSVDSLSDESHGPGVRKPLQETPSFDSSSMEVDTSDGEEEEEDSFNVTLRTPLHPSGSIRIRRASATPMPSFLGGMEMEGRESSESSSDSVADKPVSAGQKRRHMSTSETLDGSDGESSGMVLDGFAGDTTVRPRSKVDSSRSPSTGSAATYSDISDVTNTTSRSSDKPEAKKRRVIASSSKIPTAPRRTRSTTSSLAKAQAGPTPARKARERVMRATRARTSSSRSTTASESDSVGRGGRRAVRGKRNEEA